MRKYFGTDGIRAVANTELTPELAFKVAKAGAYVLAKSSGKIPTIIIGRDTRISGELLESAMVAGFLSCGAKVKILGVAPTPAIAYLTRTLNVDAGVVISASHNSYEFNGIKFFSNKGMKLPDEVELQIEELIDNQEKLDSLSVANENIGKLENCPELVQIYEEIFEKEFENKLELDNNFKVAIDTANGATYKVAEYIYNKLGIKCEIINNNPNGININKNCGSTHLEQLKEYVIENKMNLGIAYDGDGDRCLAIDENGELIDGDAFLAIFSKYLTEKGALKNNTIVGTVMSNLGLKIYSEENNLNMIRAKVGDRYVLEEMLKGEYNLGGEQSGHIILLDYNTTGDGILTSIMLIKILLEQKLKASSIWDIIKKYPQVLVNVRVDSNKKYAYNDDEEIINEIAKLEKEFEGQGRILIRASGTEPLIRVMIEGKDKELIQQKAEYIANIIDKNLN